MFLKNDSNNYFVFVYIDTSSASNFIEVIVNVRENWASEGIKYVYYLHNDFGKKCVNSYEVLSLCMLPCCKL